MFKNRALYIYLAVSVLTLACSKDYEVDPQDEDGVSSSIVAEELSSGEIASSTIPSSGASSSVQVSGSSAAIQSSSTLVVNPDTLRWIGKSPVQITEIDPNNLTWTDHLGNDPGWIEVYNPAATPVNLKGLSLVEHLATPRSWVFGDVTIPAKSYRTIFCDNMNLVTPPTGSEALGKNRAHTNFKIEAEGGTLYVLDSTLGILDSVQYPSIPNGVSWGFLNGKAGFFSTITPEAANSSTQFSKISAPVSFATSERFLTAPTTITYPTVTGATVRCTQDGSLPIETTPASTGSILIDKNTVLRCAAFESGAVRGPVTTQTYFMNETTTIPVLAISVDPVEMFDPTVGLYMPGPNAGAHFSGGTPTWDANFYKDTKLNVNVEYFGKDRKLKWSANGGIDMMGNWSRMFPKKSVGIKFSETYGGSALNYPLFPSHPTLMKFKAIALRNGGNNYEFDFIRDALMCTSVEGLGIDYQKSDFVLVYYNGVYYGIHNLREKMNEDYVKTNYDIDAATVDVISVSGENSQPVATASAGTVDAFNAMMTYVTNNSLTNDANYAQMKTMVDVGNYANYVGAEIYFRNTDWPGNNLKMWRTFSPAGPFKFMLFDTDHGYGFPYAAGGGGVDFDMVAFMLSSSCNVGSNCPNWPNPTWSTELFRKLIQNPTWKPLFINRLAMMLSYWFTPAKMTAKIDAMMSGISQETKRDIDLWNNLSFLPSFYSRSYTRTNTAFASEVLNIKDFASSRPAYVRQHLRDNFSELGTDADLNLVSTGPGNIQLHGFTLPEKNFTGSFFNGYGVEITAVPATGAKFTGWSDGVQTITRTVMPGLIGSVTANFQ